MSATTFHQFVSWLSVCLLLISCGNAQNEVATTAGPPETFPHADLFRDMRGGGYVIYFRHATATSGEDPSGEARPGWWMSCDSTVARQLSATGREMAGDIGIQLRRLNLPITFVYTSEFCRCRQTAELFRLAGRPVESAQELTAKVYSHENLYESVRQFAQTHVSEEKVLLLVGHRLEGPEGVSPLNPGDALVFRLNSFGILEVTGRIPLADWLYEAERAQ